MHPLRPTRSSLHLVGTLLRMLTWLTFDVAGKSLGVSMLFALVALLFEFGAATWVGSRCPHSCSCLLSSS